MPFYTLQSGEEILLDVTDIPEPPEQIFKDNPYLCDDQNFKQWRSAQKARYTKACYKAIREAKDSNDFINRIGDARSLLKDPCAWEEYLSYRGLDKPKRKPGRPKLPNHLKKQNPRIKKRSDQMKVLLFEIGIEVSTEGKLLINGNSEPYEGWIFQLNGRIKFMGDEEFNVEPYTISIHQFISEYC